MPIKKTEVPLDYDSGWVDAQWDSGLEGGGWLRLLARGKGNLGQGPH